MPVPFTFASATTSIPLSQLDANFATNATVGNTAVGLGNTTTTIGNLTLNNATINSSTLTNTASTSAGIPQTSKSANYTTILADANGYILHPTSDNNARTFTIDSNANVAYANGTSIMFINQANTVTIAINVDTMIFAGNGTTGSRTLAANGVATATKANLTCWFIAGTGLT